MSTKKKAAPMKRRNTPTIDPRCYHCHTELSANYDAWRAPFRDQVTGDWLWGTGVVICGPSCPELPVGETVFRRRPPVESWRTETPDRQTQILAEYDL